MTINIPDRLVQPLQAMAKRSGISAEEYVQDLLEFDLGADLPPATEEEKIAFMKEVEEKLEEALNDPRPSVPWTDELLESMKRRYSERIKKSLRNN